MKTIEVVRYITDLCNQKSCNLCSHYVNNDFTNDNCCYCDNGSGYDSDPEKIDELFYKDLMNGTIKN